jgi:hypothetical protein
MQIGCSGRVAGAVTNAQQVRLRSFQAYSATSSARRRPARDSPLVPRLIRFSVLIRASVSQRAIDCPRHFVGDEGLVTECLQ